MRALASGENRGRKIRLRTRLQPEAPEAPRWRRRSRATCYSMHRVEQLVDSSLGPLLREDCDETAFVKGVLDAHGTGACLEALSGGSHVLGAELGDQVSARYEQLLSEVHAVQALEAKLLRNNERVDSLMQAVRRIRAQCSEPYARMQAKVTQLDQMQQCADVLRSVQRLLYQCRKLRESAAALGDGAAGGKPAAGHAAGGALVTDLPRVALSIHEAEESLAERTRSPTRTHEPNPHPQPEPAQEILAEADLSGISLVDEQLPFLRQTGARLREQAHALLQTGVSEQNQAVTGVALQARGRSRAKPSPDPDPNPNPNPDPNPSANPDPNRHPSPSRAGLLQPGRPPLRGQGRRAAPRHAAPRQGAPPEPEPHPQPEP